MKVKLRKMGNSVGFTIPHELVKEMNLNIGDECFIDVQGHTITLSKAPTTLQDLFIKYIESEKSDIIFNDIKGREVL